MQWSIIKSWAKEKGYKTSREKATEETQQYNYYWELINDSTISGVETSVRKLAFTIFNHMTNYAYVEYQKKYKEEQDKTDIDHNEFKEGW